MAEYIEREALLKKMKNWHEKISLIECVNSMPAADVAPVRHGQWVEWLPGDCALIMTGEEMLYRCSSCDAKYSDAEGYKYCTNCGAKMDERKDK